MFITLEGIEGVGKTTYLGFMADYLAQQAIPLCLTREPGGTPLGNALRTILLAHREERMDPMTELLLMFAARVQHIESLIKPALAAEKWVLCDRFVDASYAYQGAGRGIPKASIQTLEQLSLGAFEPDYTFIFDAPVEVALARMKGRGTPDRIESETLDFFERARQYYRSLVDQNPKRYHLIDASRSLETVKTLLVAQLQIWVQAAGGKPC